MYRSKWTKIILVSEVKTWVNNISKWSMWDGGNVSKYEKEVISFLPKIFSLYITSHAYHPSLPVNFKITFYFNPQFSDEITKEEKLSILHSPKFSQLLSPIDDIEIGKSFDYTASALSFTNKLMAFQSFMWKII